jgi:IclR family transcriptional regulator, acetate operon repressor
MQSVLTALRVLEFVSESQPVGVSEVARALDIPKSSAQRSLVTLSLAGWIQRVENDQSRWTMTTRALVVGNRVNSDLIALARPAMEQLHGETRETIHFLVREGDALILVEHLESPQILRSSYPLGTRMPMTATSSGKAFLAALAPEEGNVLLQQATTRYTETTVTDVQTVAKELDEIRVRGFATNRGEFTNGIHAVGAVVLGADERPVAAISVSLPSSRMSDDRRELYGAAVSRAAQSVSALLGYRAGPRG